METIMEREALAAEGADCIITYRATYSPADNKIRLYPSMPETAQPDSRARSRRSSLPRIPTPDYYRVRAAGFISAHMQACFVAPRWTPDAADLATELAGEIADEDMTLVDRQAIRADRFGGYSDKRADDAERALEYAEELNGGSISGSIVVGHHHQRRAEKKAEKIERAMEKAVNLWETSEYWVQRAKGALRHAKYKELPRVRANRIGTIEADQRREMRSRDDAARLVQLYTDPLTENIRVKGADKLLRRARLECFRSGLSYEDAGKVRDGSLSYEDGLQKALASLRDTIARCERWIVHTNFRLTYERTMLGEQGASHLIEKKPRPKQLPLCNYRAPDGLDVHQRYMRRGELEHLPQREMTSAEYQAIHEDDRWTVVVGNSHRVRYGRIGRGFVGGERFCVFLTDSKVHKAPAVVELKPAPESMPAPRLIEAPRYTPPEKTKFDAARAALDAGVKAVSAPQLFPTPDALAQRMIKAARLVPGDLVLEPSAGTGALLRAMEGIDVHVVAVERSCSLADSLFRRFSPGVEVICADFLDCVAHATEEGQKAIGIFKCIVMNPPFADGQDIEHVTHALTLRDPDDGRLVAIMGAGVLSRSDRKTVAFRQMVKERGGVFEMLPPDTFKVSGTGYGTVMLTI